MINQLTSFFAQVAPFAITGVIVTGIVQYAKQFLSKTKHKVLLLIGASVVVGGVSFFVKALPDAFLTDIVGVLAAANAVYVLFVQWFENPTPPPSSFVASEVNANPAA